MKLEVLIEVKIFVVAPSLRHLFDDVINNPTNRDSDKKTDKSISRRRQKEFV